VPEVHAYDPELALVVMEALRPHIILRKGLIAGTRYPRLAEHMGTFLARTLFLTSDLALTTQAKKALMARFAGNASCARRPRRSSSPAPTGRRRSTAGPGPSSTGSRPSSAPTPT
jgi:hypothetical protein